MYQTQLQRITGFRRTLLPDGRPMHDRSPQREEGRPRDQRPVFEGVLIGSNKANVELHPPKGGSPVLISGSLDNLLATLPYEVEIIFHDGVPEGSCYLGYVIDFATRLKDRFGGKLEIAKSSRTPYDIFAVAWVDVEGQIWPIYDRSMKS
jgi:hypothetical protein